MNQNLNSLTKLRKPSPQQTIYIWTVCIIEENFDGIPLRSVNSFTYTPSYNMAKRLNIKVKNFINNTLIYSPEHNLEFNEKLKLVNLKKVL